MRNKNKYMQGIILFFINCIFFCSFMYFSGGLLPVFCKTVKNPDTYVKLASKGCCYTNWKQVGESLYLNIDNICYYKDKEGNKHALITEKLMKDNQMSAIDKICIERFKKPFHYCHFIKDINLNGKTETLLFMGFHTDDEYLGGISFDKNNPENTSRFEVCQLYQYLMDNSNSN